MNANTYAAAIQKETSKGPVPESVTEEWRKVVEELGDNKADAVPDGWMDREQLAPILGVTPRQAFRIAKDGVRAGSVESKSFKVRRGKTLCKVQHFRTKK